MLILGISELDNDSGAVLLNDGHVGLAEIVRALDQERLEVENIQLHQASLDDVFLAKTGRSLEGAGEDEEAELVPGQMQSATA